MADLYVSTSGSDSNSGSKNSPFKSIKEASEHADSGTTVHVAPGTYQGGFQTDADGVTYVSDVKWGARLVPGPDTPEREGWNNLGDDVVIDGFEVDGSHPQGGTPWLYGVLTSGSDSTVRNVKVHDIARDSEAWDDANSGGQGGAGIMADGFKGATGITVADSQVYDIGPDGESSTLVHGIYIGTSGRVENNTVHDVVGDGISSWHDATDLTVLKNTIHDVHGAGILIGAGNHEHGSGPNDHSVISDNTITNSLKGIEEDGDVGQNNTYRGNTVHGNDTDWSLLIGSRASMAPEGGWDAGQTSGTTVLLADPAVTPVTGVGMASALDPTASLLTPARPDYYGLTSALFPSS